MLSRRCGQAWRHALGMRWASSGTKILAKDASFTGGRNRSCGIVGMPNVGKSTLFNALTNTQNAEASNYPFCTIKPNVGLVSIPDPRLAMLASVAKSKKIIGAQLEFVDIAGLVKGASEGAGLGNQFLGNIRQVSVIMQLLRCFDDTEAKIITHVEGSVNPVRDLETIETELLLADIQTLSKRLKGGGTKKDGIDTPVGKKLMERVMQQLDAGKPARDLELEEGEVDIFRHLQLLTAKPQLLVCNVAEGEACIGNTHTKAVQAYVSNRQSSDQVLAVSCTLEDEVSQMSEDEEAKQEMLKTYGLEQTGLARIVAESNKMLQLRTFYTVGPQEARAWSFPAGMKAPQCAGIIHSDFEKGFIRANTISYQDYIDHDGEAGAKLAGKERVEGKDYVCSDGDVYHFLHS